MQQTALDTFIGAKRNLNIINLTSLLNTTHCTHNYKRTINLRGVSVHTVMYMCVCVCVCVCVHVCVCTCVCVCLFRPCYWFWLA